MSKKIMVAGYGSAGQYVLDFLLKDFRIDPNDISEIHVMSRKSEEEVSPRLEISKIAAGIVGRFFNITYHSCDFNDIDKMAEILSEVSPDFIVYTGRYVSGIKYGAYSYPNQIGYGVWLPLAFPYIYKLMQAVKKSGIKTKVINSSFPDGVNYLLSTIDMAPYCGAGNLSHLIPRIRRSAIELFGNSNKNSVYINLIGSHYLNTYVSKEGTSKGCPSYLKVRINGKDVCDDDEKIKEQIYKKCKDDSASGQIRNQMIATDCEEIIASMINREVSPNFHVPGLNGFPGGARVKVDYDGNLYYDNDDILEGAEINIKGLRLDGIHIVEGAVEFTEYSRSRMKSVFNIDYPEKLYIEDIQKFADKIVEVLKK